MKKLIPIFILVFTLCSEAFAFSNTNLWETVLKEEITIVDEGKIGDYFFKEEKIPDSFMQKYMTYSVDGETYTTLDDIITEGGYQAIYNEGLYFLFNFQFVGVPIEKLSMVPKQPVYVLDSDLNLLSVIDRNSYLMYKGYRDGLHFIYIYPTTTSHLVSADGINWELVNEGWDTNDKVLFNGEILTYTRDEEGNEKYYCGPTGNLKEIMYEKPNLSSYTKLERELFDVAFITGKTTETWYDGRIGIKTLYAHYVTLDGINFIEMPEDCQSYMFEQDGYYYFNKNKNEYYRIKKDFLTDLIRVVYNNKYLSFENPPVLENDRTLIPMRFLFEQMGAEVSWDEATNTATVSKASDIVSFSIDNLTATVNAQPKTMDVPARLINDKTYIPLRFLSEELGYTVEWDEETNTVTISE